MLRVLIPLLLLAPALSGAGETPSGAERDAARRQSAGAISEALEQLEAPVDAERQAQARSDIEAARAAASQGAGANPAAALPDLDPATLERARADIRALLADPALGLAEAPGGRETAPAPIVFVSLSMPEAALRALLRSDTVATLALRGMVDNSMARTVARLAELAGIDLEASVAPDAPRWPALVIDPTLFQRFEVSAVPAFVLPLEPPGACSDTRCETPPHVKVAGDVTLDYALGVMAREAASARARALARHWLGQLGEGG